LGREKRSFAALALVAIHARWHCIVTGVDVVDEITVEKEGRKIVRYFRRGVDKERQHSEESENNLRRKEAATSVACRAHSPAIHWRWKKASGRRRSIPFKLPAPVLWSPIRQ